MEPRKRNIIIILIIALLLLFLWWFFRGNGNGIGVVTDTNIPDPITRDADVDPAPLKVVVIDDEKAVAETGLQSLSKTFVERFGSFSNESNFGNIKDVLGLMSSSFRSEMQNVIDTGKVPEDLYIIITKVLSVTISDQNEDEGTALAEVNTQREETQGTVKDSEVLYQIMNLSFVKEAGVWKVASADWE